MRNTFRPGIRHDDIITTIDKVTTGFIQSSQNFTHMSRTNVHNRRQHHQARVCATRKMLIRNTDPPRLTEKRNRLSQTPSISSDFGIAASLDKLQRRIGSLVTVSHGIWLPA